MARGDALAVGALGFIVVVTGAWWALALWPLPAGAPAWLAEARLVCFRSPPTGLPDAGGWILLIGEPAGMLTALVIIARESLRRGLGRLAGSLPGRTMLAAAVLVIAAGAAAAGSRIASAAPASRPADPPSGPGAPAPAALPPAERSAAPALDLVDQHGDTLALAGFAGRPVLVTFAFAHCTTVCPSVVRDALAAGGSAGVPVVVVTLDPWRDTPARLPHIAASWALGERAHVASGDPAHVERVLDAWQVPRARDRTTGDVAHPRVVVVVDGEGRVAARASGGAASLAGLLHDL